MCVNASRQTLLSTRDTEMTKNETETTLRTIFRNMDAHEAQEIREAYYKAVEGLRTLADALEIADTKAGEHAGGILLTEHFHAVEAIDAMHKSELGRVL